MQKMRGIKRRWMFNTLTIMVLVVCLAIAAFSMAFGSYCYSTVQSGLEAKANTSTEYFNNYMMKSYTEYYQGAVQYTDDFAEKDRLELQFINAAGNVEVSSYELGVGTHPDTQDIRDALTTGQIASWSGSDPRTGERILATSSPMIFNGNVIGVMRYVTGLELVDQQIALGVGIAVVVGVTLIVLMVVSNLLFIRSIVDPVQEVTAIAKRIAQGSYGVQIEKKYNDEIGELTDTINDMSMQISQSEKMKSEFISSVSHELRTPLTAISGWGETLVHDDRLDGDTRRGINIILKESHRLTVMVEELLDFTRISDGRFTLRIEQMDLQAELEDTVYTYREFFRQDGIRLDYEDEGEEFPLIPGDPERVKQVLCNVLDNAAKHGGSGKHITVSLAQEEGKAVIRIRDFGPGIPEADLPHVKSMFYKGSSRARGSGIGLSVCDEIVRLHNGQFDIENAEGGGTRVIIRLPMGVE